MIYLEWSVVRLSLSTEDSLLLTPVTLPTHTIHPPTVPYSRLGETASVGDDGGRDVVFTDSGPSVHPSPTTVEDWVSPSDLPGPLTFHVITPLM